MSLFEQKSLLAKLMATENMHIRQSNVATASFDVKNRVLTVPILDKNLSKDVYDLFMGHECGHALWTPLDGMLKAKKEKVIMSVLNVVEDSRIERRIKNKYPGIKGPFVKAYDELFKRDFFETNGKDVSEYNFVDRVNLHCKVGAALALPFTAEERELLNEIESTETFDDVIEVSKKICDFMKDQLIQEQEEQEKIKVKVLVDGDGEGEDSGSGQGDEDFNDADVVIDARSDKNKGDTESESDSGDGQSGEDNQNQGSGKSGNIGAGINMKQIEEQIRSFTDEAFKRNEQNLFSKDGDTYVYANVPKYDTSKIMDYKDMMKLLESDGYRVDVKDFNRYRREASKVVSYLVKEFELRKNADQMKRASTAKTGDLNMNRLYSYNFTEDIFKKITVLPNGQSHGLVMFLDWSGSMVNHIANTTKQLLNLTMFCKKTNIPFEVYSFIDGTNYEYMYKQEPKHGDLYMSQFGLINLLSSRMSSKDFTYCASALMRMSGVYDYSSYPRMPTFMYMSGTPLNEAVIAAMEIVPEFQKRNRLQIVNTVFLTDGEGSNNYQIVNTSGYGQHDRFTHMVIRDPKTHDEQVYERHSNSTKQTDALIRLLKSRTNSHVIGFFVGNVKDIAFRMNYFFPELNDIKDFNDREIFRDAIRDKFRKESSLVVTSTGFDDYYVLRSGGLDTDDDAELTFKENATTRGMATAFSKFAGSKISSRVVLNRFIELIS